jgi:hypothetical protein
MLQRGRNLVARRIYTNPRTVAYRSAMGLRRPFVEQTGPVSGQL